MGFNILNHFINFQTWFRQRKHCHIIETGAHSLTPSFCAYKILQTFVFQTITYFINHVLTSPLWFDSLYCELIQKYPNLPKFRVFGYLCYLSLWPYNSHKLEPRSRPCIFLGHSLVRDTYHAIIQSYIISLPLNM